MRPRPAREETVRLRPEMAIQYLKGIGPDRAVVLAKIGVKTVEDLMRTLPIRHLDRRNIAKIGALPTGDEVTIEGTVKGVDLRRVHIRRVNGPYAGGRPSCVVTARVADETGTTDAIWFNQAYLARALHVGDVLMLTGRSETPGEFRVSDFERVTEEAEPIHTLGLVPVYKLPAELNKKFYRHWVWAVLAASARLIEPTIPKGLIQRHRLLQIGEALGQAHFPKTSADILEARRTLAYEELFLIEAVLARRRMNLARAPGAVLRRSDFVDARIRARLPFTLTKAQERAIADISRDLASGRAMYRLLQGDVGCGKTAVAFYAALVAVANHKQAAILAPTEILAEQHVRTFSHWLADSKIQVAWLRGRMGKKQREAALGAIERGEAQIVIGTHALLEEDVKFQDLAFTVIDEQQRFGVHQRTKLVSKGRRPHVLVMTATPIPRTLQMTACGDLDLTVIDEMPPGRAKVTTLYYPPSKRPEVLDIVRKALGEGRQAFFVFPLIDPSDKLPLAAAVESHKLLQKELSEWKVGLLHGRLKQQQKDGIMEQFRAGEIHVLVSTIVVEVGIDVPNATVMVIDNADRYGLSQMHQLRGRIGRAELASTCILMAEPKGEEAQRRIDALLKTTDGFKIAEEDLAIRGPGEFLGTQQSGWLELRAADLVRDVKILASARDDAFELVRRDPNLRSPDGLRVARGIPRVVKATIKLTEAG